MRQLILAGILILGLGAFLLLRGGSITTRREVLEVGDVKITANRPDCPLVVSVPTDAPFLPADLVACLAAARRQQTADLACAASGGQSHPVVGLWPVRLRADLRQALANENIRKVDRWTGRYRLATVPFEPDASGIDPFFNANRPEDLATAARLLDAAGNMRADA